MAKKPSPNPESAPLRSPSRGSSSAFSSEDKPSASQPQRPRVQVPGSLSDVLGQQHAIDALERAMRSNHVHHAWIFQGPTGVGKFTAALAFASALLDPTTTEGLSGGIAPDPDSAVQVMLRAGAHPDLAVISKELSAFHSDLQVRNSKQRAISVKVLHEFLLEPGALAPTVQPGGKAGKVFIIDEAELLNTQAQNALLKFLEEPPQRVVIILVCSSPESLLPTIRSRCQRVSFAPLSHKDMKAWARKANLQVSSSTLDWLLEFADGSPGVAMSAAESDIASWWHKLAPLLEQAQSGTHAGLLGVTMHALCDAWAKDFVDKHKQASKESANRAAADWVFRLLAWKASKDIRASKDPSEVLAHLACLDALHAAEMELDANVSGLFVMEKLAAELSAVHRGDITV